MDLQIKDKIAVITGGDSGIGYETAKILAQEETRLILSDVNDENLKASKEKLLKNFPNLKIETLTCDLTNNEEVQNFADQVKKEFGNTHILVNSAGARGAAGDFLKLSDEDWMETIQIDLMAAVRVCRAFIPQMQINEWGRIVLVSSENAFQPYDDESPYNACKAALINLSKCLSRIYGKQKILVNSVSPAFIESPMTNKMMEQLADEKNMSVDEAIDWFLKNKRPHLELQRRGQPDEVASVISFLCSERASFVNGSNYRVDAGSVQSAFG